MDTAKIQVTLQTEEENIEETLSFSIQSEGTIYEQSVRAAHNFVQGIRNNGGIWKSRTFYPWHEVKWFTWEPR